MTARSALAPAAGSGPGVGVSAVRAIKDGRTPARAGTEGSAVPARFSEDDPSLEQLVREREPSLAHLVHEREPHDLEGERFYSALFELLERRVGIVVGEWDGTLP